MTSTTAPEQNTSPPHWFIRTSTQIAATVQQAREEVDCAHVLSYNENMENQASDLLVPGNSKCMFPLNNTRRSTQVTYLVNVSNTLSEGKLVIGFEGIFLGCDDAYMVVYYDLQNSHPRPRKMQCPVFFSNSSLCMFHCDPTRSCTSVLPVTVLMQMPPWDTTDPSTVKWCKTGFGIDINI